MVEVRTPRNGARVAVVATLVLLAAALVVLRPAPASAFDSWQHDGVTACGTAGCHLIAHTSQGGPDDAACTACHTGGFATPRVLYTQYCGDCHTPGSDDIATWQTNAGCSSTCHLASNGSFDECDVCHYADSKYLTFSHGTRPHAGADSAPCLSCHAVSTSATDPGGSPHHGAGLPSTGDCQGCHNGTQGSLQVNHDGITDCESCHDGMDIPAVPATCNKCHVPATFGSGTCTASTCHGTSVIHTATPSANTDCGSCHADKVSGHYSALGACADCHRDVAAVHHGGTGTPPTGCQSCHDGTVASAQTNHDGVTDCESCHTGMDIPPVPATCNSCHAAAQFGTGTCTASACHGTGAIHTATPGAGGTCLSCHTGKDKGHFETLGTCVDCHPNVPGYHHTGAQTPPLAQCRSCHDGTITANQKPHDGAGCTCHDGMDRPAVPQICGGCHKPAEYGTGSCASASCHGTGVIHEVLPETPEVCADCHTDKVTGHFETLGTCQTCHPDIDLYHHHDAKAIPLSDCAACHDGGIASAPGHGSSYGTTCSACHTGMSAPSAGACMDCHQNQQGQWPAVEYTNDLACADAGCHGKIPVHAGAPVADAACTDCHSGQAAGHYEGLGTCEDCHADVLSFHHGTAEATPLAQCATCHDGSIATAKTSHDGVSCASCHDGMDVPPVPATCNECHDPAEVGTGTCTSTGCHGTGVIHTATPGATAKCADCHADKTTGHFEGVAACADCHTDVAGYHHGGAQAVPLAECATCHDGKIASSKVSHDGIKQCSLCHDGMNRPVQAELCTLCHAKTIGRSAGTCTDCHSADGMFAREQVHTATPDDGKTCVDCHATHYGDVGTCGSCHAKAPLVHHGSTAVTTSSVTLAADPVAVTYGEATTLRGTLKSGGAVVAAATVSLQVRAAGTTSFAPLSTATTDATGAFTYAVAPPAHSEYRAIWAGASVPGGAQGPAVAATSIDVRPVVTLTMVGFNSTDGRYARYRLGRSIKTSGTVQPSHARLGDGVTPGSVVVTVEKRRFSRTLDKWVWSRVKTTTVPLDEQGGFTFAYKPAKRGKFRLIARFAADGDHLGAESAFRFAKVY